MLFPLPEIFWPLYIHSSRLSPRIIPLGSCYFDFTERAPDTSFPIPPPPWYGLWPGPSQSVDQSLPSVWMEWILAMDKWPKLSDQRPALGRSVKTNEEGNFFLWVHDAGKMWLCSCGKPSFLITGGTCACIMRLWSQYTGGVVDWTLWVSSDRDSIQNYLSKWKGFMGSHYWGI